MASKIAVMYLGKIVEFGPADEVFRHPQHPYTKALFNAIPHFEDTGIEQLATLEGTIPSPISPPPGCAFHTRCDQAFAACKEQSVDPVYVTPEHYVACLRCNKSETKT